MGKTLGFLRQNVDNDIVAYIKMVYIEKGKSVVRKPLSKVSYSVTSSIAEKVDSTTYHTAF
jgi:hypothetical protein